MLNKFLERQKATRQMKKLRKRLLETESTHEVEALKEQMHIAEVDLNYTQYCPLSEPYVSLYPQKSSTADGENGSEKAGPAPKPALWAEVEKCMEDGTLNRLRNRLSATKAIATRKPLEMRPPKPKPKPQAAIVDTTGMNRRERRSLRVKKTDPSRTKNKSMGFEKNKAFGATQAIHNVAEGEDGDDSEGGFFEE